MLVTAKCLDRAFELGPLGNRQFLRIQQFVYLVQYCPRFVPETAGLPDARLDDQNIRAVANEFRRQMPGDIREVRDYLLAEILTQQPPAIKNALLRTSFLDRFNAGLCEAVAESTAIDAETHTEHVTGDDFLLHIQEAGLLGIALDDN